MSKAKRRVLWVVLNLGSLAGVVWVGFYDGPQAVANLVTFYAWLFLLMTSLMLGLYKVAKMSVDAAEEDPATPDKVREAQAKLLEKTAGISEKLSVPRWLDRTFDCVMAITLAAAGWFVVATVWLLGMWMQYGLLKIIDYLSAVHWKRVEESLGVKL